MFPGPVHWHQALWPRLRPCVLFISSPTSSRETTVVSFKWLWLCGCWVRYPISHQLSRGPGLPPTNHAFASKISKLGNAHTSKDPLGVQKPERIGIRVKTTRSMGSLCEWQLAHTGGPSKWHSHQEALKAFVWLSLHSNQKERTYCTYPIPESCPLILPFP